jgi:diguanylate cyclase (GGDEF)-like protein
VARWGGDEFLIVLPDIDTENATRIGQRIIQNANQQILKFGETENKLSISIGMTSVAHGNGSRVVIEDVFRETDRLLYEAKNAGRNRLCYSPMKIKK